MQLPNTRNNRPLLADLILAKLLNIPRLSIDRPGKHSEDLIDEKRPGRSTTPTRSHPETKPLNPLTEIMGIQHIPEESRLGDLIVLLNTNVLLDGILAQLLLSTLLLAPDLPQLLVVEIITRKTQIEDRQSQRKLRHGRLRLPPGLRHGAVDREPGGETRRVADLEAQREEPHEDVDRRHGRLDEREENRAVEVVDDKEAAEDAILPGEVRDAVLLGEGVHDVQKRQEPRGFHGHPANAARDVERRGDRGLAHSIPFNDPLEGSELRRVSWVR